MRLAYTINPFGPNIVFLIFPFTLFCFPAPLFAECGTSQWFSPSCAMTPVRYSHPCRREKFATSKLSKSVVRAVFGLPNPISTQPLQNELHVSEIADIMFRKALVFVYRCLDAHASSLFTHYYCYCVTGGNHRRARGQEARLLSTPFRPGPADRASIHFSGAVGCICYALQFGCHLLLASSRRA